MIYSHTTIYRCPQCGEFVSKTSPSGSYRSTGIRFTDGKLRGLDAIHDYIVNECKKCGHLFWIKDDYKIGVYDFGPFGRKDEEGNKALEAKVPNWGFVSSARLPDIYGLHRMLATGDFTGKKQEIYLRKNLHWSFNDRYWDHRVLFLKNGDQEIWEENLKALIPLIRFRYKDTLYLAEIYRNLGKFYRARWVLLRAVLPSMKNAREVIWHECKKKNSFLVPYGKGKLNEYYVDGYPDYVQVDKGKILNGK